MSEISSELQNKHIIIMAGGTGGHVFPALAVADALKQHTNHVSWLGTELGIEARLIPDRYPIDYLTIKGLRKKGFIKKLLLPVMLIRAVTQAAKILRQRQADIVVGFGGYASGPGGIAAFLLGKKLIIHEQNAIPGLTNRYLSKVAKKTLLAFPARKAIKNSIVIGNPLREPIKQLHNQQRQFIAKKLNILVLGGSLGAKRLNTIVPGGLKLLGCEHDLGEFDIAVKHQCGRPNYQETMVHYSQMSYCQIEIQPFIDDMASSYEWADVIIARAGACSVSEIAAAKLPAILVPYPYAVDDHQYENAQFLVRHQAAVCFREQNFTEQQLADQLNSFLNDVEQLRRMSKAAGDVAKLDATGQVISQIEKTLQSG